MESKKTGKTQKVAAAQAGISERSARKIEKRGFREAKPAHDWKTRKDPFESVWESQVIPMLEKNPHLQARTILEELQMQNPGEYPDTMLRTLQRRVRKWKAISGPEKEVIFRQNHPPGWQGMSDFTHATCLGVTIQKEKLEHMFYHYRLVYSKWEAAFVILGGESFTALSEGLQNALWLSSGVPETHRTDSLSAAYKNCSDKKKEEFTKDYVELCAYYQMEPTRNNKGIAHENGAIEASHGGLKNRVDQALMLRGSRDFSSIEEYKQFIQKIVLQHNRRVHKKFTEELAFLRNLPERKTIDFSEERSMVTSSSTIRVRDVVYSVPSRLIGMTLKVHLYDDRLECFIGNDLVTTLERKRRNHKRVHQINYRHVIGALHRKPQAFRNYIYREELFPTLAFRETWERLNQQLDSRKACREYVKILKEAALDDHEKIVNSFLEDQLQKGLLPKSEEVQKLFRKTADCPQLAPIDHDLKSYDVLVGGAS
ncbi:MAG: IS21 family transposase [Chlamydiia bacterium]|nr:IS21 family transposase [Chlamydiia bacterium]